MSDTMHGFELLDEKHLSEVNGVARRYRHVKTGASLLSIENDDTNKVFGITFRTPPEDHTGLPHILEHSVLCGSRKYPVKEPFVELLKGSLNTFLNAMTYPDKTVYPVASQNLQDFYNLVDVYLDAVFHPRITPQTLQQEGWHYEMDSADGPLTYKGVVFNEMKGAYGSPDNRLYDEVQRALFPDTRYANNSGGDPAHIPDLTFEVFKAFHERYYHPSNSFIYFYGDDEPTERLRILDAYLSEYEQIEPNSTIELQSSYSAPREVSTSYPASEDEGEETNRAYVTVAWLLPEGDDPERTLELGVMGHLLVGTAGAPLRKALIDSGLGEDLTGRGVEDELRQLTFVTGLKGTAPDNAERIESLILETLADIVRDGVGDEAIEAALNSIEFALRENNTGPYPRGLLTMLRGLSTWLHDGDPLASIAFEAPLAALKEKLAAEPSLFERLIQEHLLDNPHRVRVLLQPDTAMGEALESTERDRLDKVRATLSNEDIAALIADAEALREAQARPDAPEALASIPTLRVADMERSPKAVPTEEQQLAGIRTYYHDIATNGILYLDLGMDLHRLPQRLLPLAGLFGRALLETGSATGDFVKLQQRIHRTTGGINAVPLTSNHNHDADHGEVWLFLRGKAMVHQAEELADILHEVLTTARLDNQERIRQLILEEKAGIESGLLPMGHRYVARRLRAHFTEADWADEQINGIDQLFLLRDLADKVESKWKALHAHLEEIRTTLVQRGAMVLNATLDREQWESVKPQIEAKLARLPEGTPERRTWHRSKRATHEGLTIPGRVNYVGKGAPIASAGGEPTGQTAVIARHLRSSYIWDNVRVQGGAYGGFLTIDPRVGLTSFLSYRDPNLVNTLKIYDGTAEVLRAGIGEEEIEKSVIGMVGDLDAHQLPDAQGWSAMERALAGVTDADRQRFRDEVLSTKAADFAALAPVFKKLADIGHVTVIGSQAALDEANETLDRLEITKLL